MIENSIIVVSERSLVGGDFLIFGSDFFVELKNLKRTKFNFKFNKLTRNSPKNPVNSTDH